MLSSDCVSIASPRGYQTALVPESFFSDVRPGLSSTYAYTLETEPKRELTANSMTIYSTCRLKLIQERKGTSMNSAEIFSAENRHLWKITENGRRVERKRSALGVEWTDEIVLSSCDQEALAEEIFFSLWTGEGEGVDYEDENAIISESICSMMEVLASWPESSRFSEWWDEILATK